MLGCTYYVVVAIVWSIIWYIGLDPIKWCLAYALNEDGFRDRKVGAIGVMHTLHISGF